MCVLHVLLAGFIQNTNRSFRFYLYFQEHGTSRDAAGTQDVESRKGKGEGDEEGDQDATSQKGKGEGEKAGDRGEGDQDAASRKGKKEVVAWWCNLL